MFHMNQSNWDDGDLTAIYVDDTDAKEATAMARRETGVDFPCPKVRDMGHSLDSWRVKDR